MPRKVYLLFIVLFLVGDQFAFARHSRWRCRNRGHVCCRAHTDFTYYCLEDMYMDFPPTGEDISCPDLYLCLVHPYNCPNISDSYQDFWYGRRDQRIPYPPQRCFFGGCEREEMRYATCRSPGHEQFHTPFADKDEACEWLIERHYPRGAPPGLQCNYYKITNSTGQEVFAVIIKAHGHDYFGLETEEFENTPVTAITNSAPDPQLNPAGTLLTVDYRDPGPRHAVVWMRFGN
jgi:hypothetical protein